MYLLVCNYIINRGCVRNSGLRVQIFHKGVVSYNSVSYRGPFIYYVNMFWGFSDPPSPLVIKSKHMARPPLNITQDFHKLGLINEQGEILSLFLSKQTQKIVCSVGKKSQNVKRSCSFIKQVRVVA